METLNDFIDLSLALYSLYHVLAVLVREQINNNIRNRAISRSEFEFFFNSRNQDDIGEHEGIVFINIQYFIYKL